MGTTNEQLKEVEKTCAEKIQLAIKNSAAFQKIAALTIKDVRNLDCND